MTETEALEVAAQIALDNGWPWLEPVQIVLKKSIFRSSKWAIRTNHDNLGCNICIEIDNDKGVVVKAVFLPR